MVWAYSNTGDFKKLESIQIYPTRVGMGVTARCNTTLFVEDVGWPTLVSHRRAHRLIMFYEIINGLPLLYLINLLPRLCHLAYPSSSSAITSPAHVHCTTNILFSW